jgi:hypothetical protein
VLAGATALAFVTYFAIERPFDRVRRRVRGMPTPEASAPLHHPGRARVAVAAAAIALAVLTVPMGYIAAQASREGAGALASSPVFDVRWRPDVTEAERLRIERELGLVNMGQVERDPRRRTWTYRLQSPTFRGLRAVVAHAAVEDTAGLDDVQLEILRQQ